MLFHPSLLHRDNPGQRPHHSYRGLAMRYPSANQRVWRSRPRGLVPWFWLAEILLRPDNPDLHRTLVVIHLQR